MTLDTNVFSRHIGRDVRGARNMREVMDRAGINYTVSKRPIALCTVTERDNKGKPIAWGHATDENGAPIVVPDRFAVTRDDTGAPLQGCIVGGSFTLLQQAQALAPFDSLVERGVLAYNAAGNTKGGARVWVKATLPGLNATPVGKASVGDTITAFVMLAYGHGDGTGVTVTAVTERKICDNGATARRMTDRTIRHHAGVAADVGQALFDVDAVASQLTADAARWSALTECFVESDEQILDFLCATWRQDRDTVIDGRKIERIATLFGDPSRSGKVGQAIGADMATARGTLWGLFQALSQHYTHEHGRSAETRTESRVWGDNAKVLARGIDVAYAMGVRGLDVAEIMAMDNGALAAAVA